MRSQKSIEYKKEHPPLRKQVRYLTVPPQVVTKHQSSIQFSRRLVQSIFVDALQLVHYKQLQEDRKRCVEWSLQFMNMLMMEQSILMREQSRKEDSQPSPVEISVFGNRKYLRVMENMIEQCKQKTKSSMLVVNRKTKSITMSNGPLREQKQNQFIPIEQQIVQEQVEDMYVVRYRKAREQKELKETCIQSRRASYSNLKQGTYFYGYNGQKLPLKEDKSNVKLRKKQNLITGTVKQKEVVRSVIQPPKKPQLVQILTRRQKPHYFQDLQQIAKKQLIYNKAVQLITREMERSLQLSPSNVRLQIKEGTKPTGDKIRSSTTRHKVTELQVLK